MERVIQAVKADAVLQIALIVLLLDVVIGWA
jgi:hypothetical protein